jgi:hydroxymethylpyrimidine pyrophosphatase-like HAD family hydrolase
LVTVAPIVKLLVRGEASGAGGSDALLAQATTAIGARAEVTHSSPRDTLLEISAAGVDKATGLARYAAQLGVGAHEVAAVGDMPNDLPMLGWAGAAYAVHGGHPSALAAAPGRVAAAADDGVAVLLSDLLVGHRLYR